ncbi:MAG: protein-disulfide reductase DsbD family protein [Candidatus Coprenecus sp.]
MKFKSFLSVIVILLSSFALFAQETHVKWNSSVNKLDDSHFELVLTGQIDSHWHIYDTTYTGGPKETLMTIKVLGDSNRPAAKKVGPLQVSGKINKYYDDVFMVDVAYFEDCVVFTQQVELLAERADFLVNVEWQACDSVSCVFGDEELKIAIDSNGAVAEDTISQTGSVKVGGGNLLSMIIEAIIWGLVALLTPCIFPMVPMTVSFFMKGSPDPATGRKRAFLYGFFIIILYTLPIAALILITRIFGGDAVTTDIFNWLATNWLPNIIFFIVFIVFALSFFGLFEITLPGSVTTKTDSKADTKGFGGIFFMALTLVLVSFSCTGPIVGNVVIRSVSGEFWTPIVTMLAFSTAFALPFTLLAMFPSLLSKMPKSGGWLGSVKVILGFVETALAFKFLSMADQAYHWNILPRDIYLAIWIVIFTLLFIFMLGFIRFKGVDKVRKWSAARIIFTIIVLAFDIYLITGLFGAPLRALSGYLPPEQQKGWFYDKTVAYEMEDYDITKVKYADKLKLSHGLNGFFDLEQARAYAKKVGKPLFIDFTGHACVNCREMESRVWADPRVLDILRNQYVICALYCDDKMEVPEENWIEAGGKTLKTLGKINSYIAFSKYGANAQPYYILESPDGRKLAEPRGYNLDVEAFIEFLNGGIENFKNN